MTAMPPMEMPIAYFAALHSLELAVNEPEFALILFACGSGMRMPGNAEVTNYKDEEGVPSTVTGAAPFNVIIVPNRLL